MTEEKQKIANVLGEYQTACNTADAQLAASLYTKDAILLPGAMQTSVGSEAISNFYAYAFSQLQLSLDFDIDMEKIEVKNNFAFATTSSTGTRLTHATGKMIPENNRELWVFEHVGGEWKIARYMFNKTE